VVEVPEVPKWIRAELREDFRLTESPSSIYSRVVIEGPTWQVKDQISVEPDEYRFDAFMVMYLEHHEGAVQILAGSKTRAYMLEWSPVLIACVQIVENGALAWVMVDDLCEDDKIHIWEMMGQSLPRYRRDRNEA
jgi:hypothetical protein